MVCPERTESLTVASLADRMQTQERRGKKTSQDWQVREGGAKERERERNLFE